MTRQLIVNADDLGRSPGVTRGILQAHREGIVTSASMMINQPGAEAQLADALGCPSLGVGLHLVFTAWKPLLPADQVPGLVDEHGYFLEQHSVWAQAERVPVKQLRAELQAQVECFLHWADRLPDHLDCHHFVHLYPPFFQVYADLAFEYGLPLRVPFPAETEFVRAARTLPFLEGFPRGLVRGMIATNSALLRSRHLAYPDLFVSTFYGREALTLEHLLSLIDAVPEGISELMCHPGYVDAGLRSSTYRDERETEIALLTDPAAREHARAVGIELVSFSVLARQGTGVPAEP
jgi:predicted glycoside hydrolase/deacetylase ChbG (UPF0249 family)